VSGVARYTQQLGSIVLGVGGDNLFHHKSISLWLGLYVMATVEVMTSMITGVGHDCFGLRGFATLLNSK